MTCRETNRSAVSSRCPSLPSLYLPHIDVSVSAAPAQPRGRPWLDSSIPSLPGNPPTPPRQKRAAQKRKEQTTKKKACNVFTRPADFPGCKSSAAGEAEKCRPPGLLRWVEERRNNMTSVKSLVKEAQRNHPVLPKVSSPHWLSWFPSSQLQGWV